MWPLAMASCVRESAPDAVVVAGVPLFEWDPTLRVLRVFVDDRWGFVPLPAALDRSRIHITGDGRLTMVTPDDAWVSTPLLAG